MTRGGQTSPCVPVGISLIGVAGGRPVLGDPKLQWDVEGVRKEFLNQRFDLGIRRGEEGRSMCQLKSIRLSRRDLGRASADVRRLRRIQEPASRLSLAGIVEIVFYSLKKKKFD